MLLESLPFQIQNLAKIINFVSKDDNSNCVKIGDMPQCMCHVFTQNVISSLRKKGKWVY